MTPTADSTNAAVPFCPACGTPANGRFCSECGTILGQNRCSACAVELIDGARFCHRCGLPAGAPAPPSERKSAATSLPWVVAAIALLAFVALVAGQRFGAGPANGSAATADAGGQSPGSLPASPAPDISRMTPAERATALHNRLMRYHEAGKRDSLMMFAPMAIAAYEMLGSLDPDGRYDLGRIGEMTGDWQLARAQADTILRGNPNHLLGLILAARAARLEGRSADERGFYQRLAAAEPSERAKKLDEYLTRQSDIDAALVQARQSIRR